MAEAPEAPGSPEALAKGCTCDPVANANGIGRYDAEYGDHIFQAKSDCPLHGLQDLDLSGAKRVPFEELARSPRKKH